MGLDKSYPNWTTLYDFENIIDHIGPWRLVSTYWTKSHPHIIPGKSWLSIFCVLAAAGAPIT